MTKSIITEKSIIELFASKNKPSFFENDAASILIDNVSMIISQDTLNEGIHFDSSFCGPEEIALRAFCANASDMAAMGMTGTHLLQSLTLPKNIGTSWSKTYAETLLTCCNDHNITLIGGDTCQGKNLSITLTIVHFGPKTPTLSRKGNLVGNHIYVSKATGGSLLGLTALQTNHLVDNDFLNAYLRPKHEIILGQKLLATNAVSACMDITDSLVQDLKKLCELNQVDAKVNIDAIPEHPLFTKTCLSMNLSPPEVKITGGEDYALLIIGPKKLNSMIDLPLYDIGTITDTSRNPKIDWVYEKKPFIPTTEGFHHFDS